MMIITMTIGHNTWNPINSFFYTLSSTWTGIAHFFFLVMIGTLIIRLVSHIIGLDITDHTFGLIAFIIASILIILSIINAAWPGVNTIKLSKHTLPESMRGKKIALVSDIHVGMVRYGGFVQRISKLIMNQQPDMILIAGDLIDGPVFPYEQFLKPLEQLSAPLGIYYTPGNHEGYNIHQKEFYATLPKNITQLIDRQISIPEIGMNIIGIDYRDESLKATEGHLMNAGYDANTPTIVILHDPKNVKAILKHNPSLVVSGHTHGGQFFPANLVVKNMYGKYARGLTYTNDIPSITTVGIGTAVSPMRMGVRAEIVIIEIQ
jgi:predicted MPP superfamily phosphohydrolase